MSRSGSLPSVSSSAPLPNRAIAHRPPNSLQAGAEHPGDRAERVLVCAHRAGCVDHEADVRFLQRRGDDLGDLPRVGGDGRADRPLGVRPHVGAGVESTARGAFVDPLEPDLARLVHPPGVLARHLHLVGHRRAVDAAVGQPPGRHPGAAPSPAGRLGLGGRLQQRLQVEVLVQLLELALALLAHRLLERFAQRLRAACGSPPPVPRRRRARCRRSRVLPALSPWASSRPQACAAALLAAGLPRPRRRRRCRGWRGWGRADDLAVLARVAVERVVVAVLGPDQPGEQVVEPRDVVWAEHLRPQRGQRPEPRRVAHAVVGSAPSGRPCCARRGRG